MYFQGVIPTDKFVLCSILNPKNSPYMRWLNMALEDYSGRKFISNANFGYIYHGSAGGL